MELFITKFLLSILLTYQSNFVSVFRTSLQKCLNDLCLFIYRSQGQHTSTSPRSDCFGSQSPSFFGFSRGFGKSGHISRCQIRNGFDRATLEQFQEKLEGCIEHFSSLQLLLQWVRLRVQAENLGLTELARLVISGGLEGSNGGRAFELSLYEVLLTEVVGSTEKLASLTGTRIESLKERYAALDRETLRHNAGLVASAACSREVPEGIGYGTGTMGGVPPPTGDTFRVRVKVEECPHIDGISSGDFTITP